MYERDKSRRWTIFGLSLMLLLSTHYCTYVPTVLEETLQNHFSDILSSEEFQEFFESLYLYIAVPNIIAPFFTGYLIDNYGLRLLFFCLVFITTMGEVIFANGLVNKDISECIIGRFVFGLGSESLQVAVLNLIMKYFQDKEIAQAISSNLAFGNLGCILNILVTPTLVENYGLETALWFGPFSCLAAFGFAIIIIRYENLDFGRGPSRGRTKMKDYEIKMINDNSFRLMDRIFWYLMAISFFLNSAVLSWSNHQSKYFIEEWFYDLELDAKQISAVTFLLLVWASTAISGPVFGYMIDNYGRRTKMLIISCALEVISIILLLFSNPSVPSFLLGISYSLARASLYPCVNYVVQPGILGRANGIIACIQNAGYVIFPYVINSFKDPSGDYYMSIMMMLLSSLLALIFSGLVYKRNIQKGFILEIENSLMETRAYDIIELGQMQNDEFSYKILNSNERLEVESIH